MISKLGPKKNLSNKKGQAAMEFLMTYGWAILIVLVAIAALYFMGVFEPQVSGKCIPKLPLASCGIKLVEGDGIAVAEHDFSARYPKSAVDSLPPCLISIELEEIGLCEPVPTADPASIACDPAKVVGADTDGDGDVGGIEITDSGKPYKFSCNGEAGGNNPLNSLGAGDNFKGTATLAYKQNAIRHTVSVDISGSVEVLGT